jgi:hypothetical protein
VKRGIDFIGVGVGAILVDDRGQLFLARRGPQAKNERGLWEFLKWILSHIFPS